MRSAGQHFRPEDGRDGGATPAADEKIGLSLHLQDNLDLLTERIGHSFDVKFRRFRLERGRGPEAGVVYIDGLTSSTIIHRDIMLPLMMLGESPLSGEMDPIEEIAQRLLLVSEIEMAVNLAEALAGVFAGDTVLLVEGSSQALVVNSKGWKSRGIEMPSAEADIRGPGDSFNEDILTCIARMRRRIKDQSFHAETMRLGRNTHTTVGVVYLRHLVNRDVLQRVKRRLENVDVEGVIDSGYIQEFLQGKRWSVFPLIQSTERPDRAVAALLEGRIVIVVDNSPFVLIVPAVLASMFQAAGDYYLPSPIGTFLRVVRVIGWALGLFLPGLYVAVSSVNPEVLPPALAMTLASARVGVPYPAVVEVFLMDLSIELLAEASTRLPRPVGGTATLVGGLIIGTAAVEAKIISSTMIIVVAVTAIGLFTIPNYELGLAWRISKYLITLSAAALGLFGIANAFIILVIYLASQRSFGLPYLSPVGPYRPRDFEDFILRAPWWRLTTVSRTFSTAGKLKEKAIEGDRDEGGPG